MSKKVSKKHTISRTVSRRNYWPGRDASLVAEERVMKIQVQSNTDIESLFVYRNLWRYIEGRRRWIEMLYSTKFLFTHFYGRGALRGFALLYRVALGFILGSQDYSFLHFILPSTSHYPNPILFSSHVYCIQVTSFNHLHIPYFPIFLS